MVCLWYVENAMWTNPGIAVAHDSEIMGLNMTTLLSPDFLLVTLD